MVEIESVGLLGWQCGDSAGMRGNSVMIMINMINIINIINMIHIINMIYNEPGLSDPEAFRILYCFISLARLS